MAKEGSVAPKERINIVYKPATGGAQEEIELPLKIMMIGDYLGRKDDRAIEDREPISINKDNFNDVMRGLDLKLDFTVQDTLTGQADSEIPVHLRISDMKDFLPDSIARQIPDINKLLELRDALVALKGPLGNVPTFRRKLESIITDEATRKKILDEIKVDEGGEEEPKEGD